MSILNFIESIRDEINHSDISIKQNALMKLSRHLSKISFYETNTATVDCILKFYINLLDEHYTMLNVILEGILVLIDFKEFSPIHARLVATSIVQMDVTQLNVSIRLLIFNILERLFSYNLNGMELLDVGFIRDYITAVSGESDPQCVLHVMRINAFVARTLKIDSIYEELFETISAYFPIEFKTNKNSGLLTRIQLVEANNRSMLASPLFGSQLFPILMDKLSSDMKTARVDSLELLGEAVEKMNFEDVLNYHMTFVDILYHQYKTHDPEIQELVRKSLCTLSSVFQQKATETQLLELCWHLFEICYSAISSDRDATDFLLIVISNRSRLWSGVLAYFLPKIMEKIVQEKFEDLERIDNLINVLSAFDNLSQYKGLIDNPVARVLFTEATRLFYQIDDFSNTIDDQQKITVLFRLLSTFSIFNVTLPESEIEANFSTDTATVINSQVLLVTKAVNSIAISSNEDLRTAITAFVPRMIELTLENKKNLLTELIFNFAKSNGQQSDISYLILSSLSPSWLQGTLDLIYEDIQGVVRESVLSCLAVITKRFHQNLECNEQLSAAVYNIVQYLLNKNDNHLSKKNIDNVAFAIGQLGETSNQNATTNIFKCLICALRSQEPSETIITWFCSIVGLMSIENLQESIKITELLYMLLGLVFVSDNVQPVCQTYASVVNKSSSDKEVETFVLECLCQLKNNVVFLLSVLKASIHAGQSVIVENVIEIIIDTDALSTSFGRALSMNIDMLSKTSVSRSGLFSEEERLFPRQTLFYEQQIYYLLAQKYQHIAEDGIHNMEIRDIAMELYLKLVTEFSESILEVSLNEVTSVVINCLSVLSKSSNKVSLKVQVLKSLSHIHSESMTSDFLSGHLKDIGVIIISVADQYSSLTALDRLFLAKSIIWFIVDLGKRSAVEGVAEMKAVVAKMIKDKKRVVRKEAAKAALLLQD